MDMSATCEHLNKLSDYLEKELWQSKESLSCFDCGCPGPNLWICLQPECHHVGCSEVKNDHSTLHQKGQPSHCVHMNVSTERVWCYACEKEVHIQSALIHARLGSDPSVGGSAARLGFDHSVAFNVSLDDDDAKETVDEDDNRPRGLVGLQNLGNTCYMNAALQALSNTLPFTEYFLQCAPPPATQNNRPALSRSYQKLIREMWSKSSRGYVVPNAILYGIRNAHPMFRGYGQHDAQEFLRCFMDQLHEELKEPIWDLTPEDELASDAEGDAETRSVHVRRRAASSGASEGAFFPRVRRHSPAPSTYSESRADGYLRVHTQSESGSQRPNWRHKRSASFAGVQQNTYNYSSTSPIETHKCMGSESDLSSEAEEKYETCSSNSDVPDTRPTRGVRTSGASGDAGAARYRSVVSDVFDGKLLSAVQCLICDRVSTRVETFQDLSLPIPSREHLMMLRSQQPILSHHAPVSQDSWVWWVLGWLRSWFYGPVVSLQDCLAAFFSADELKGDNMYSCSRCNKLRNGVKMSGVVQLPEVLCVHLKRFRHELMFSSKVGSRVAFPLYNLDMTPYTHKECKSKITRYDLCAVIIHCGTAGGGHYTCIAKNNGNWYQFDDTSVQCVPAARVASAEAYVLLYKKVNPQMAELRRKAAEILESTPVDEDETKYYISRQWINKFNTWAEPGPIDNSALVCRHGAAPPRLPAAAAAALALPYKLWHHLHKHFGGGPVCTDLSACKQCARGAAAARRRRERELRTFLHLHHYCQEQSGGPWVYCLSMSWFRRWQAYVRERTPPPPPIDNEHIVAKQDVDGVTQFVLKPNSEHAQISEELWRFFYDIYGGGPEVRLRNPNVTLSVPTEQYRSRKQSESDKEDYCPKANSDINITNSLQHELQKKNQSLQNINRHKHVDSDEDCNYRVNKRETNGNYPDSDEEMDVAPPQFTARLENGVGSSSSDHDANDNPIQKTNDIELPNLDSISLKGKSKSGKVRKIRRRTVK